MPLGKCCRAAVPEGCSPDEMAFEVEVLVNIRVDGSELL